jgi:hypothetical protein
LGKTDPVVVAASTIAIVAIAAAIIAVALVVWYVLPEAAVADARLPPRAAAGSTWRRVAVRGLAAHELANCRPSCPWW